MSAQTPSPHPSGDEAAVEALFRAHYRELCAFAYRYVQSRAMAEEVVQNVFAKVWERRHSRRIAAVQRAYLYRAVRNRALKHLERARTEERWTKRRRLTLEPAAPDVEQELGSRDLAAAVQGAVDGLPSRCKETFLLVRRDGLQYAEAARVLGVSPKTVKAQLGRAVKLLRERLLPFRPE